MKQAVSILLMTLTTVCFGASWNETLDHYAIGTENLISRQCQTWASGKSPKIADPIIKAIPIYETKDRYDAYWHQKKKAEYGSI